MRRTPLYSAVLIVGLVCVPAFGAVHLHPRQQAATADAAAVAHAHGIGVQHHHDRSAPHDTVPHGPDAAAPDPILAIGDSALLHRVDRALTHPPARGPQEASPAAVAASLGAPTAPRATVARAVPPPSIRQRAHSAAAPRRGPPLPSV